MPSPKLAPHQPTPLHSSATPMPPGQPPAPSSASSNLALAAASAALAGAAFSSKLLGVVLVASADFGTRCLFRYPVPPPVKAHTKAGSGSSGSAKQKPADSGQLPQSHSSGTLSDSSLPSSPQLRSETGSSVHGSSAFIHMLNGGPATSKDMASMGDSGIDSDSEPLAHAAAKAAGVARGESSGPSASPTASAASEEMYGMSPDDFARLFCPKQALCAQVLDVMVDSLRFVSFPVRLHYQESREHQRRARSARHKERLTHRHKVNRHAVAKKTHAGAHMTPDVRAEQRRLRRQERESKQKEDADSCSTCESVSEDGAAVPSPERAVSVDSDSLDDSDDDSALDPTPLSSDSEAESNEHDLTFFNVVFILAGSTSQALASMYGNVAALLARALLHEQTRANFVSQQTQLLVTIRDKYLTYVSRTQSSLLHVTRSTSGSAPPTNGSASSAGAVADFHALSHLLLNHSLLANHLYQLYYGLIHQEYERFGAGGGAGASMGLNLGMLGSSPLGSGGQLEDATSHGGCSAAHAQFGHVPASQQGSGSSRVTASYTQDGIAAVAAAFHKLGLQYSTVGAAGVARNAARKLLHMDHSHTQLLINNWFMLHFTLTPAFTLPSYNPHSAAPIQVPQLQPYHTILLTVPADTLLQSLPSDCSPILRTLIRHADPRHSFHALSVSLRIRLPHLYKLVLHLLYWNKCILMDVVSMDNVYGINPAFCQLGNNVTTATGSIGSSSSGRSKAPSVSFASSHGSAVPPSSSSGTRRSSSSRPSGHSGSLGSGSSGSSGGSATRRRSASVESSPPGGFVSPSFIPAPLLYEYSQRFAPATFLSFLARVSTHRTLGEHLHRVAFAPVFQQQMQGGPFVGAGLATSSSASVAAAATLTAVQRELQAEFMEQLLFMLKRQWVRQVHKYIVRIDEEEDEDEESEEESEEEEEREANDDWRAAADRMRAQQDHNATARRTPSPAATATVPATADDPWRALLDRLTPLYFDGRHSLTEILWLERDTGLTLGHLQHLCALFPTQLFIVQHM